MKQLINLYHQHDKTMIRWGSRLGAALILVGQIFFAGTNPVLAVVLDAAGGAIGGAVLVPLLSKHLRAWLTGAGAVVLTGAITMLTQCTAAAAPSIAMCPTPGSWWAMHLPGLLAALGSLKAFGAWVAPPDAERASTIPAPPKA